MLASLSKLSFAILLHSLQCSNARYMPTSRLETSDYINDSGTCTAILYMIRTRCTNTKPSFDDIVPRSMLGCFRTSNPSSLAVVEPIYALLADGVNTTRMYALLDCAGVFQLKRAAHVPTWSISTL